MPKPKPRAKTTSRPKFIQIACSSDGEGESLYALDDEGTVYFYDFEKNSWAELLDEDDDGD